MTGAYKAPNNVSRLQTPKTNPDVWDMLKRGPQIVDSSVQKVQSLQVAMLSSVTRMVDGMFKAETPTSIDDHSQVLTDIVTMSVMSFNYLSQIRKDVIRNSCGWLAKYCTWETPVGKELLFDNLNKTIKEKEEAKLTLRRKAN